MARRGHPEFPPRWGTRKSMRIGYMLGLGRQAPEISEQLADGTSDATIRKMRGWAGLKEFGNPRGATTASMRLTSHQARLLRRRAKEHGLSTEEWLRRIVVAAIEDNLYQAIVDAD